tara:strand:+ start:65 stop:379 length:315 start_codon:yes stop_codon:yes gene_type:complete
MKKVLLKFWAFLNSIYLQSILGFIAFISWDDANHLGNMTRTFSQVGERLSTSLRRGESVTPASENVAVAITSGYDGGALAMGLITCACLISIVWLEVNKSKLHK